jgi:predicted  nucleic acid-binding Zn-ribbon protein
MTIASMMAQLNAASLAIERAKEEIVELRRQLQDRNREIADLRAEVLAKEAVIREMLVRS